MRDESIICLLSTCRKSTHYPVQTSARAAGARLMWENFLRPARSQRPSLPLPLAECGYLLAVHSSALMDGGAELGLHQARGTDPGTEPLFCPLVSAAWGSQSVDSGAFQQEDRSLSSQMQQRFAYSAVASSEKNRVFVSGL